MSDKKTIPAVFKEDLKTFLQSVNEWDAVERGERICHVCSKTITLENIQLIIPRQANSFDYICDSPVCLEEYNRKKETQK